jgi:hypothetical protein
MSNKYGLSGNHHDGNWCPKKNNSAVLIVSKIKPIEFFQA